jgi:hypothetical protein
VSISPPAAFETSSFTLEKVTRHRNITGAGSGITAWRVPEDHELPDVRSVGQPLLYEL